VDGQSEVDNEERDDEIRLVAVKMVQPEPAILVMPGIDHLILRLTTYYSRRDLSIVVSVLPTDSLWIPAKCLFTRNQFNRLTAHAIDLDGDVD
jgi:hypothetical protein